MVDADKDDRADGVKLAYTERVQHAADSDGTYPFAVAGYKVTKVGYAVDFETITIQLKEKVTADIAAKPAVTYTRTSSDPVKDAAGNEAKNQTFTKTRPLDIDKDGFTKVGGDCNVKKATIYPGAPDVPDAQFVDSDCDGIDGKPADAVFVSPTGEDTNIGTRLFPMKTIGAAIQLAGGTNPPRDVYVSAGEFEGPVELQSNVDVFGAYSPTNWSRASTNLTKVIGSPEAAVADGDTNILLQWLTLAGVAPDVPGASAYGLRAINGSSLTLEMTTVQSGAGSAGADGAAEGVDGASGDGGDGGVGGVGGDGGGTSEVQQTQGRPGRPGGGTLGGTGGAAGGGAGGNGGPGSNGAAGDPGQFDFAAAGETWDSAAGNATAGSESTPGSGGGGGGGGSSTPVYACYPEDCTQGVQVIGYQAGGAGGKGGDGGSGGTGGDGGDGGGGSFGIYLEDSQLTATSSAIAAGNGGAGGNGRDGGEGGAGQTGQTGQFGPGGASTHGGKGGNGGAGGNGGGGGGGSGGPSVAVMQSGACTFISDNATELTIGDPGAGGAGGLLTGVGAAPSGENGEAHLIFPPPLPPPPPPS